jgi:hypothetical protein
LLSDGLFLKLRLLPWIKENNQCTWLVSLAISKSKRQINDWLSQRKNKRCKQLSLKLTGKHGPLTQAIAVRQLREWFKLIPKGDIIFFRCESFVPDKQFRVWKKWFKLHESEDWIINPTYKYFLRCK